MDTPIVDFVRAYSDSENIRAHMPGHKGSGLLGIEALDITEISGADVLYHDESIIKRSRENAAKLFGTACTQYSAEGSSLCIRAMLLMLKLRFGKPHILAGRNAHKTFVSAAALLDIDVDWIFPENGSYISCDISAERLDCILSDCNEKPNAVYITSPDYLGNIADIRALADVCHKYGVLLFVDNAHGAYLNFLSQNIHPIYLGADVCCDSAHKTLPALTGSAYLHISKSAPEFFSENAAYALSVFASTSPSYLILQSLDALNPYLENDFPRELQNTAALIDAMKKRLSKCYSLIGDEALKLSIYAKSSGYTGYELAELLEQNGIHPEFSDPDFLVMMFTPQNSAEELERVEYVLMSVESKPPLPPCPVRLIKPERAVSMNSALLHPSRSIAAESSIGSVLAALNVSCPPAVPIIVCGERIDKSAVELFSYYGIETVSVL